MHTSCPTKEVETSSGTKKTEKSSPRLRRGENLAAGVLILTVSGLFVKVIGMLFKIPMNYFAGDTGMGYYNAAYSIYTFFYMLSTAGLPTAVSVMAAAARAEGQKKKCQRILQISLGLFCLIGLTGTAVLGVFPAELAGLIGSPPSEFCIRAIAPALFFICIASALRGYFQGLSHMVPTAVSQLLEAVFKAGAGILGVLYGIHRNAPPQVTAAYAITGLTLGSAASMVYLLIRCMRTKWDWPEPIQDTAVTRTGLLKNLIAIAIPITLSAAVMSLTGLMDTVLIQRLLQENGLSQEAATTLYGNYTSLAVPLFNLPPVMVYPIAYALVPLLSGNRNTRSSQSIIQSALRLSVLIGMPGSLGLAALSEPILKLLYRESSAVAAAPLLTLLAPSSFLVCLLAVTNAVLQSIGRAGLPVCSMLAGGAAKIVTVVVLTPVWGITAAPISTFACYLLAAAVNLCFVVRYTGLRMGSAHTVCRSLAAALLCAVAARGVFAGGNLLLPEPISVLSAIASAVGIYLLLLRELHLLQCTDLVLLPAGRKLSALLGIPKN